MKDTTDPKGVSGARIRELKMAVIAEEQDGHPLGKAVVDDLLSILDAHASLLERNTYLETVLDCSGGTMVQAIIKERDALLEEVERLKKRPTTMREQAQLDNYGYEPEDIERGELKARAEKAEREHLIKRLNAMRESKDYWEKREDTAQYSIAALKADNKALREEREAARPLLEAIMNASCVCHVKYCTGAVSVIEEAIRYRLANAFAYRKSQEKKG